MAERSKAAVLKTRKGSGGDRAISAQVSHRGSAPSVGSDGEFLGVLSTSVTTGTTLGLVESKDPHRSVVLVARKDVDSPETLSQDQLGDYAILFHPAYGPGDLAVEVVDVDLFGRIPPSDHGQELNPSDLLLESTDDYRDPAGAVHEEYQGRWIAGFAPVGSTGFVVIVQQHYEKALELDPAVRRSLLTWSALVIGLAMAIMVAILLRSRSQTRSAV